MSVTNDKTFGFATIGNMSKKLIPGFGKFSYILVTDFIYSSLGSSLIILLKSEIKE